jgi:hypothetical protein
MKKCSQCFEEKEESEFYFIKSANRYVAKCKICYNSMRLEYKRKYERIKRLEQPEKIAERRRKYKAKFKPTERKRAYDAEYARRKRVEDPLYRFKSNMRRMVRGCLKKGGYTKRSRTFEIIGCDFDSLRYHIERQFLDGMSWDLVGERIHIDHIVPLASAKSEDDTIRLCHYTNLRPLWAEDNLSKGAKVLT